jgi:hypothetical protein
MAPATQYIYGGWFVKLVNTFLKFALKKAQIIPPVYGQATRNPQISEDVKADPYAFK